MQALAGSLGKWWTIKGWRTKAFTLRMGRLMTAPALNLTHFKLAGLRSSRCGSRSGCIWRRSYASWPIRRHFLVGKMTPLSFYAGAQSIN